jgi:small-conductance mechanosensitive channel
MSQDLLDAVRDWLTSGALAAGGRRLVAAVAVVAGAFVLAQVLRLGLDRLRHRIISAAPLIYIVEQLGAYAIILIGFVVGLSTLGVNLASLTVFAGAIGVGAGLGLQGVVKEFVSGVVLIFDPSIQVGDYVELQDEVRGEVVEIGARATRLRTNDDLNVVIPNSSMMQGRVINWTYNAASRRFHIPFSVAAESDRDRVREVVLAAARGLAFTLPDDHLHKTQVWLTGFGGAGLDFDLVVWPTLESSRHPRTMHAAYTWAIHVALQAAGIATANNQLDVRLRSLFGREGDAALQALDLAHQPAQMSKPRAQPLTGPNDAAAAIQVDEDRQRVQRAEEPRRRGQAEPPDAA